MSASTHNQTQNQDNTKNKKTLELRPSTLSLVIKMILCAIFWGGTFIAGRISAPYADPALIGFFRFLCASLVLLCFTLSKHLFLIPTKKQFLGIILLASTGILTYNLCFFLGLQTVPANRASLIIANNPLAIALGAAIFLKEKLTIKQLFGVVLSILGASIIISKGDLLSLFNSFSQGDLIILGCVASWTIYSLLGKVVINTLPALITVTWTCIIGSFMFLPLAFPDFSLSVEYITQFSYPFKFWLSVFYLGFFGTALGFVWFYDAVKYLGAAKAAVFINIVPISGVILSALILNEPITLSILIGGIFTLTGVYIASKKTKNS